MINDVQTPDEIKAQVADMFKPSAAQIAEFNYLRAGYLAERRENRRVALKVALTIAVVGIGSALVAAVCYVIGMWAANLFPWK